MYERSQTGKNQRSDFLLQMQQFIASFNKNQKPKKYPPISNQRPQIQHFKNGIGVLHSIFMSKNKIIVASNMATAFLVAPDLIITCRSNLYNNKMGGYAHQFQFVAGLNILNGEKPSNDNIFKAFIIEQVPKLDLSNSSFDLQPRKQDLALLKLQKPVQISDNQLPFVGNLERIKFDYRHQQIVIVGYPSLYFQSPKFRQNAHMKQQQRYSRLVIQKKQNHMNHVLSYQLKMQAGMTGSPILAIDKHGEIVVIGIHIHTHRPKSPFQSYNQTKSYGLHFTEELINKIKILQLKAYFSNLQLQIGKCQKKIKMYQKVKEVQGEGQDKKQSVVEIQCFQSWNKGLLKPLNELIKYMKVEKQQQNLQKNVEVAQSLKQVQQKIQILDDKEGEDMQDSSQQYQNKSQLSLDGMEDDFL